MARLAAVGGFDIRNVLSKTNIKKCEEVLKEKNSKYRTIFEMPLEEVLNVSPTLTEDKVAALILQGAWDEAGFWKDLIQIHQMTGEKEEVPMISMRDFAVRRGEVSGSEKEAAGGKYTAVSLSVAEELDDRYMLVTFKERDIRLKKFNPIERGMVASGAKFGKNILGDITKFYVDNGTSVALGATEPKRHIALATEVGKEIDAGFKGNVAIMNVLDFTDMLVEQAGTAGPFTFLSPNSTTGPTGPSLISGVGVQGLVGALYGKIPLYVIGNDANLSTKLVIADKESGGLFGLSRDITLIGDFTDPIRGIQQFKLGATYDIALANAAAIRVITGA